MINFISTGSIFSLDNNYSIIQFISKDCKMSSNISVEFRKRFNFKSKVLKDIYENNIEPMSVVSYNSNNRHLLNLVIKEKFWNRINSSKLDDIIDTIVSYCYINNINHISISKKSFDCENLEWNIVKYRLLNKFNDSDINLIVFL